MPFSPSDLSWWGWLLCSIAAWVVCIFASALTEKGGCLAGLIALMAGVAGTVTGVMGAILFVKWVWYG